MQKDSISNVTYFSVFYLDMSEIETELRSYLKRKRIKIVTDDFPISIQGISDNRIVKIELKTSPEKVGAVVSFFEKYSSDIIALEKDLAQIGRMTMFVGAISGATSKGRSGRLTTAYGAKAVVSAQKRLLKKLIGPTFKQNMMNLDGLREENYIQENYGNIIKEGIAYYIPPLSEKKEKLKKILGILRITDKGILFRSDYTEPTLIRREIQRKNIAKCQKTVYRPKGFFSTGIVCIELETPTDIVRFLPKDMRFKKWISAISPESYTLP